MHSTERLILRDVRAVEIDRARPARGTDRGAASGRRTAWARFVTLLLHGREGSDAARAGATTVAPVRCDRPVPFC
jgi:hypothetical protein